MSKCGGDRFAANQEDSLCERSDGLILMWIDGSVDSARVQSHSFEVDVGGAAQSADIHSWYLSAVKF